MKNIRNNVFETNSSSSHSIHIEMDSELLDTTLIPEKDGTLHISGQGKFGWEYQKYNDAYTKASYVSIASEHDESLRKRLFRVLKKQTGSKNITIVGEGGYIDGDSIGVLNELDTDEKLRMWIFNTKSWLFGGNDNSEPPLNYYSDEINHKYKINIYDKALYREKLIDCVNGEVSNIEPFAVCYTLKSIEDKEFIISLIEDHLYSLCEFGTGGYIREIDEKTNTIKYTNYDADEIKIFIYETILNRDY